MPRELRAERAGVGDAAILELPASSAAAPHISPIHAIGDVERVLSAVMSATFAWGAMESFGYWARLRRQHALGLANAANVRRMFLFALGCASQLAMMGFTMRASARGPNPLEDPVPALGIAVTSLAMGAAFALALGSPTRRTQLTAAGRLRLASRP